MRANRTTNRATVLGLTAGLLGGGAAGLMLGVPALTNAANDGVGVVQQDDGTTDEPMGDAGDRRVEVEAERTVRLRDALQGLVDAGTITGEQADAVAGHLAAELPGPGRPFGGRHHHHVHFDRGIVAGALGITTEELHAALRTGSSIADLAEANGVDVQLVIDALVAEARERLDAAVAAERLTQAEADERLTEITERITEMVDRSRPAD